MNLTPYLEDIERRLNEREEEAIQKAWVDFTRGKNTTAPFNPPCRSFRESSISWKHVNVNDALEDEDLMILSQLERCHVALTRPTGFPIIMRANYGVGNISRMFGARSFIMPYNADTQPNVYPIEGGAEEIKKLLDEKEPDIDSGNNVRIWRIAERFAEIRQKYPKIGRFVRIDHPDGQGPMDNCELMWGSDLFCDLYDEPELVHDFLKRITDTIRRFYEKWYSILPNEDGMVSYFGELAIGGIALRDDSAMNMSPDFFDEFIRPYDEELLMHFGGGIVHFCGRGDHFVPRLATIKGLNLVDMSQPHLNDMNIIFSALIDRGINLCCPKGNYSLAGHDLTHLYSYARGPY